MLIFGRFCLWSHRSNSSCSFSSGLQRLQERFWPPPPLRSSQDQSGVWAVTEKQDFTRKKLYIYEEKVRNSWENTTKLFIEAKLEAKYMYCEALFLNRF